MEAAVVKLVVLSWLSFLFFFSSVSAHRSTFGFLTNLDGYQKGDKTEGIRQLKQYMKRFGYLNKYNTLSDLHADDNDEFDDQLEDAIKTYQQNYNMKPTGRLEPEVISQMMKPRCGVPDIINGTNTMHSSIGLRYTFFDGNPRWPKYDLTYRFDSVMPREAIPAVESALQQWAAVSEFTFTRSSSQSADLFLSYARLEHEADPSPFDGPGGIIAHAYAPTIGVLCYDADETFAVGAEGVDAFDYETVAVHEIGHLLGLGHSSVIDSVMYPSIGPGETKTLKEDDIEGIQALYSM